jgi:hypothetical protein
VIVTSTSGATVILLSFESDIKSPTSLQSRKAKQSPALPGDRFGGIPMLSHLKPFGNDE